MGENDDYDAHFKQRIHFTDVINSAKLRREDSNFQILDYKSSPVPVEALRNL